MKTIGLPADNVAFKSKNEMKMSCTTCDELNEVVSISTYKRKWHLCNKCGCAFSTERDSYLLSFLPYSYLKKQKNVSEDTIYDYFVTDAHKQISKKNYDLFMKNFSGYVKEINKKNILDISGGSGHFIANFKDQANYVLLTELNTKAVDFAQNQLKINAVRFDFNNDDITKTFKKNDVSQKFDYVFMLACSMFCVDMEKFISSLKNHLNDKAIIILSANVLPTVGVMVRTQFDDHSYLILRHEKALKNSFDKNFSLVSESWYQDIYTEYFLEHDINPLKSWLKNFYSISAINKIRKYFNKENYPSFRLRDRHLYYLVYEFRE